MKTEMIIRGRNVVLPDAVASASIHIKEGRIVDVSSYDSITSDAAVLEVDDTSVVMPGLVDTHVHVNEPGRTEWEGFRTATHAAAAGGVTTIVDMPLNSLPPTTTAEALAIKRAAASPSAFVDVGFWGGAVPGNL